jgi:hypothetical protein
MIKTLGVFVWTEVLAADAIHSMNAINKKRGQDSRANQVRAKDRGKSLFPSSW